MMALWYKEWREFASTPRTLLLRLALPLVLLGPFMRSDSMRLPALAGGLVWLGAYATSAQVARERVSGYLPRLALTPAPPGRLMIHRVLCRSGLLAVQMAPVLAVALWLGAPVAQLSLCVPAVLASCAAGATIGLRAASRRGAQLAGFGVAAAAALTGWGVGTPLAMDHPRASLTAMGMPDSRLPATLTLWALTGVLLWTAHHGAARVLGGRSDQID